MIEALVIDMDGTLLQLPIDYPRLKQRLREYLRTEVDFNPLFKTVASLTSANPEAFRRSLQIIDDEELLAVEKLRVFDHARQVLEALRTKDYPLCLMTLQGRRPAQESLRRAGLTEFFSAIVTREDSIDRHEQIKMCVEILRKKPPTVLVVGDRLNDVLSANRLGCKAVLIRQDTFTELGEDIISIKSLADLSVAFRYFDNRDL